MHKRGGEETRLTCQNKDNLFALGARDAKERMYSLRAENSETLELEGRILRL
jgi:hypothetical protein